MSLPRDGASLLTCRIVHPCGTDNAVPSRVTDVSRSSHLDTANPRASSPNRLAPDSVAHTPIFRRNDVHAAIACPKNRAATRAVARASASAEKPAPSNIGSTSPKAAPAFPPAHKKDADDPASPRTARPSNGLPVAMIRREAEQHPPPRGCASADWCRQSEKQSPPHRTVLRLEYEPDVSAGAAPSSQS